MRPIQSETMNMNRAYWNRPEIKGTVWQNYMLVMTQWPTQVSPEGPTNDGGPFPNSTETTAVSNTTLETYLQDTSCMGCHAFSNLTGRDFVMFVTRDAFESSDSAEAASALGRDPMFMSLMKFFEEAKRK